MGIFRRTGAMMLAAAMTVAVLASCGSETAISRIKENGGLRVGYCSSAESDDAPFIIDGAGEGLTGEPASRTASSLGLDASFIRLRSDKAYDSLMDGSVDCLWNCPPPRKELVSSVRTIETGLYYRQVILVKEDSRIERLADVKGKKLAVVSGSDAQTELHNASVMENSLSKIVVCTSMKQLLEQLDNDKVQCAAVDEPQALYAASRFKEGSLKLRIIDTPIAECGLVIVTRAEDADLCTQMAEKYVSMSQSKKIEELCEKYGLPSLLLSSVKNNPAERAA